jgi:hypothetical protein
MAVKNGPEVKIQKKVRRAALGIVVLKTTKPHQCRISKCSRRASVDVGLIPDQPPTVCRPLKEKNQVA